MDNIKEYSIDIILAYLKDFIEGKFITLSQRNRENPKVFHYYNEIVRYWNKLNYIARKTLRSLKRFEIRDNFKMAKYLYSTYRMVYEKSSKESILKELNLSKKEELNILQYLNKLNTFSWEKALNGKSENEKLSLKEAIPTFIINHLLPFMSIDFLKKTFQYMNTIDINNEIILRISNLSRPNSIENTFKIIIDEFRKYRINFRQDPDFPELFYVPKSKKKLILKNQWYRTGNLIFHDKASAIVVKILSPQPNEFICDMCAAPGIKTSLIAQYTQNHSRIIAGEFLNARANQMKNLLIHLSVLNVHLLNADSIKFPIQYKYQFDRILLDAPCTGSGTFKTNPELKWRQNEKFLHQNVIIQKKLLESAIDMLRSNGILVYSTCSLYPEEGELQILNFLEDLIPLKLPDWLYPSYKIENAIVPGTGRLFPSIHGTQGFFVGKFKKKG